MVLEAGAGNGKTTAICTFFKKKSPEKVKWVSLATDCNSLQVFWSYIIEVFQENLGDVKQEFSEFFQNTCNKEMIDSLITYFVNSIIEETNEEIFLILDDIHLVEDPVVTHSLEQFLEQLPSFIHVVLLTRYTLPLYLSQFEIKDELAYIDESFFHLSDEEAKAFIQRTTDKHWQPSEIKEMLEIARGWIGGLQLLVAAKQRSNLSAAMLMKQENQLLSDYLTQEIFQQLTEEERSFLIETSYFPYATNNLTKFLGITIDFKMTISSLVHKNLLIICTDKQRQVYQYHPIFKEYLMRLFQQLPIQKQIDLKRKAANFYIEEKEFSQGFPLLLELEDYEKLMDLLLQHQTSLRIITFIGEIPIQIAITNVDFSYQKFFYHYSNLEYESCLFLLDALDKKYPGSKEVQALEGIRLLFDDTFSPFHQKVTYLEDIQNLNLNDTSKAFILLKNAFFYYYQDEFHNVNDFASAALRLNQNWGNPFLNFFGRTLLAQNFEELGKLNQSILMMEKAKQMLETFKLSTKMKQNYLLTFFVTITGVYLKQFRLSEAEQMLTEIRRSDQEIADPSYYYNYAEYLYLSEKIELAYSTLKKLDQSSASSSIGPLTRAGILRYSLKYHQLTEAEKDDFIVQFHQYPEYQNLNNRLFYAMILLDRKCYEETLSMLDEILAESRERKIYLKIIDASLLKIKLFSLWEKEEARLLTNLYHESLYYAATDEVLAIFYYYKEELSQLFESYSELLTIDLGIKEQKFHKQVLEICLKKGNNERLTGRELDVLREIANGRSNKEIGEILFISLATVKTHVLNIYRKLEVNSRVLAVEKARELNIL